MTIKYDDEKVMIIKRKIMNVFKQINKKIDDTKKLLRYDNVKFKRIFKNVFNFRFRNSNL